eukprot:EG_transcript_22206
MNDELLCFNTPNICGFLENAVACFCQKESRSGGLAHRHSTWEASSRWLVASDKRPLPLNCSSTAQLFFHRAKKGVLVSCVMAVCCFGVCSTLRIQRRPETRILSATGLRGAGL